MDSHRNTTFTQLPKINSKSTTIHKIGQWIANKRVRYARADIYNIGDDVGFNDFFQSPQYAHHTHFYILAQSRMWEYVFHLYGQKGEQKAVTVDDKVRVAGIIFREDMRPFIQDMTGKSRASTVRAVLDAASGRKLYGMNHLHENFIDKEVVINIPANWHTMENMVSVDEINGEGAFEQFGNFNPNNQARIGLDWTPVEVAAIFAKVLAEYNTAMDKYTKGTGGGSGSHAMFAVWDEARSEQHKQWKERSVGWIAQYQNFITVFVTPLFTEECRLCLTSQRPPPSIRIAVPITPNISLSSLNSFRYLMVTSIKAMTLLIKHFEVTFIHCTVITIFYNKVMNLKASINNTQVKLQRILRRQPKYAETQIHLAKCTS